MQESTFIDKIAIFLIFFNLFEFFALIIFLIFKKLRRILNAAVVKAIKIKIVLFLVIFVCFMVKYYFLTIEFYKTQRGPFLSEWPKDLMGPLMMTLGVYILNSFLNLVIVWKINLLNTRN